MYLAYEKASGEPLRRVGGERSETVRVSGQRI